MNFLNHILDGIFLVWSGIICDLERQAGRFDSIFEKLCHIASKTDRNKRLHLAVDISQIVETWGVFARCISQYLCVIIREILAISWVGES